ncbi:hypothetical protein NW117_03850 [Staphylococcus pettenkoferi]|uniref:hypothetical protein n=1 Tax=Staphylococcus pettenkoferi TaxID=170573 RepID=UPI002275AE59|nr:hypothetical protein [Staphylococcus pettenkoferi]MCY1619898.1 hypothetical protein [Staphylococcus pettenkoferi]
MKIIGYIILFLAFLGWSMLTSKYLPSQISDVKNKHHPFDERQAYMLVEIMAKSFYTIVTLTLMSTVIKMLGLFNTYTPMRQFAEHNFEFIMLVIALISFILNYITTKRKYTSKEH